MILSELNTLKDRFKEYLSRKTQYSDLYVYESIKTFQDTWNDDAPDFKSMFDASLQNSVTMALWRDRNWAPKRAILGFIDRDPDLIRAMFKELFNEKLEIDGRLDRFIWHCDQLRDDMLRTDPRYHRHDHDGFKMLSTYLAFRYPTEYAIYDYSAFLAFMHRVRTVNMPESHEVVRYFKVARSVWKIVSKDEELLELNFKRRIGFPKLWQGESLSLVWELMNFSKHVQEQEQ